MTRQKAFETAVGRRRKNPIVWIIDEVPVKLRSSVDLIEMGEALESLGDQKPEGMSDMAWASDRMEKIEAVLRGFIEETSLENWDRVVRDIDPPLMNEMLTELIQEYTGQGNPTQGSLSSDGSSPTGRDSMDGERAEG